MNTKAVFTISSKNYFAQGKTLLDSIFELHSDEIDYFYLIVDENLDGLDNFNPNFNLILAKDIDIPNFYSLAFKYNVIEFNTAVKPFFFDYLSKLYHKIVCFDPDILVYNRLDQIFKLLETNSILLTPHIINIDFRINKIDDGEYPFLQTGIFNLGFLGISMSEESKKFINWFKERTHKACFVERDRGLFVDQKWINFVPCLFNSYFIIRDKYYNVAYWNLNERNIEEDDVDSIVFYHYSSFDINDNETITRLNSIYFNLKNFPVFTKKINQYRELLNSNDYLKYRKIEYSYNKFFNHRNITPFHRKNCVQNMMELNPFELKTNSWFYLRGYLLFLGKKMLKAIVKGF
jgi:hypothetical protein